MPTHQSLGGASDDELLRRMVDTYPERFGEAFWSCFDARVAPALPSQPVAIDLGCGPGLFLRDLSARYPGAALYGYDVTPRMIEYARDLDSAGTAAGFAVLDAATQPLPHRSGTVHLLSMSSVLHVLDEPLPALAEIRRVLAPGGVFLLVDWIRQPLETYLAWRRDIMGESEEESVRRGFRLFPVHAKYTEGDWQWLLSRAGFEVRHRERTRSSHAIFVASARS
jgi:SAM-dependent methyltransferase